MCVPSSLSNQFEVGTAVFVNWEANRLEGVVQFAGQTELSTSGYWLGIQLTGCSKGSGNSDGQLCGYRHFTCEPECGIFVRPDRVMKRQLSRLEHLRLRRELSGKTQRINEIRERQVVLKEKQNQAIEIVKNFRMNKLQDQERKIDIQEKRMNDLHQRQAARLKKSKELESRKLQLQQRLGELQQRVQRQQRLNELKEQRSTRAAKSQQTQQRQMHPVRSKSAPAVRNITVRILHLRDAVRVKTGVSRSATAADILMNLKTPYASDPWNACITKDSYFQNFRGEIIPMDCSFCELPNFKEISELYLSPTSNVSWLFNYACEKCSTIGVGINDPHLINPVCANCGHWERDSADS
mmetsp:Transcript_2179/g.3143  ORF Transcript_2179/g.3143 Transcript_2179/m.3143 type:complete len:353 (+) Transcript_2179:250-1308(+)